MADKKSNAGRKTKYGEYIAPNLKIILGWLRAGYTEESIAKRLGVGLSTWEHYKATNTSFRSLIHTGRQDIGALALNNLYKRANGYDWEEVTKEKGKNGKLVVTKTVTKHLPPDVASNIFIICNRVEGWQHVQHIQHSGELMNSLSDEDCQKIRGLLKANHENGNGNNNHSEPGANGDGESQPEPAEQ